MPPTAYQLRTGIHFTIPDHPSTQAAYPANATNAQITQANHLYDSKLADFTTCTTVKAALRQQLLAAVDSTYYNVLEDPIFSYADVEHMTHLQHLTTTYGTRTINDLEENCNPPN